MHPSSPSGLIPVLATPFESDGRVDRSSLRRLVEFQQRSGADGVAVFGMASEGFTLDQSDRRAILATLDEVAPGLSVTAGVSAAGLSGAVEAIAHLADAGVTTAMVMPPHMVKPSAVQVVDFYGALGDHGRRLGVDLMIQDAPGATGVQMSVADLATMCAFDGVASMKIEAPPTLVKIEQIAPTARHHGKTLLGGQNAQFVLDEYELGVEGTMPACEFTDLLRPVLDTWETGDRIAAHEAFTVLLPLILWGLQPGIAWSVHKHILVGRGIISTATVRAPARDISPWLARRAMEVFERSAGALGDLGFDRPGAVTSAPVR